MRAIFLLDGDLSGQLLDLTCHAPDPGLEPRNQRLAAHSEYPLRDGGLPGEGGKAAARRQFRHLVQRLLRGDVRHLSILRSDPRHLENRCRQYSGGVAPRPRAPAASVRADGGSLRLHDPGVRGHLHHLLIWRHGDWHADAVPCRRGRLDLVLRQRAACLRHCLRRSGGGAHGRHRARRSARHGLLPPSTLFVQLHRQRRRHERYPPRGCFLRRSRDRPGRRSGRARVRALREVCSPIFSRPRSPTGSSAATKP